MSTPLERRVSAEQTIKDLDEVFAWLRRLGLRPDATRFGEYRWALERAQRFTWNEMPERTKAGSFEALVPCLELIDVHRYLAPQVAEDAIRPRLERLLKAPVGEETENATRNTSDARNIGFELALGAMLAASGARVDLPADGDLDATVGDHEVAIECKRLQNDAGVESATRQARRQLETRVSSVSVARVVALDVSRIVRPPSHLFHAPAVDELNAVIAADFQHARKRIEPAYRRGAGRSVDVVMLVVAVPTHTTTDNVWWRAEQKYTLSLRRRSTRFSRVAAADRFCEALGISRASLPPRRLEPHERGRWPGAEPR